MRPVIIYRHLLALILIAFVSGVSLANAQGKNNAYSSSNEEIKLPSLGDSASNTFSLQREYTLGRAWLKAFRSQVDIVSDPLLQDYVEDITYRLATYSELKDRRLDLVIVNNKSINAFAVPGGVLGIHNGLLLQAETEAQFSSVISHELAHLSQRHFARGVEAQQRSTIPNLAGLLAGIIIAATAGGDAGIAAITAAQAASLQSQLRYSRLHEQEADRSGMQTMVRAGMDPHAAAGMFAVMQRTARYSGTNIPEFLLTHPITESRISDAKNRARQHTRKMYADSTRFHLMRARIELSFISNSGEAVERFRAKVKSNKRHTDANEYGLVLALIANGNLSEAQQRLDRLRAASPTEICYLIAQAELNTASGQLLQAKNLLNNALALAPGNHPLTMALANTYLKANQPQNAEALLKTHTANKPNDPSIWYLLAETHGLAGNIIGVHQARAEYFVLNGALDMATKQLGYALPLVKKDHVTTIRFKERIAQIKQMKRDIKNL